jgi:hypothetical protein
MLGKDIPKHYSRYTEDTSSGVSFWEGRSAGDEEPGSAGFSFWKPSTPIQNLGLAINRKQASSKMAGAIY